MLLLIEQPHIHRADYFVWEQKNGSWSSKAAELAAGWRSGWLKWNEKIEEEADNGDKTPSKLCSSQ